MSEPLKGFLRGVGVVLLFGFLNYVGDASHLNGILSASAATIVSGLALALEHYLNDPAAPSSTSSTTSQQ